MGAVGNVCIEWKDHERVLVSGIVDFFRRQFLADTDVTFYGDCIKVHRFILAIFLPDFRRSLMSNRHAGDCGTSPKTGLTLDYVANQSEDVQALIEFIYTGRVNVQEERLVYMKRLADDLSFDGLAKAIEGRSNVVVVDGSQKDVCSANTVFEPIDDKGRRSAELSKLEDSVTIHVDPLDLMPIAKSPVISSSLSCSCNDYKDRDNADQHQAHTNRSSHRTTRKGGGHDHSQSQSVVSSQSSESEEEDDRASDGSDWRPISEFKRRSKRKTNTSRAQTPLTTTTRHQRKKSIETVNLPTDLKEKEAVDKFCQEVLQTWEEVKAASKVSVVDGEDSAPVATNHGDVESLQINPTAVDELPKCQICGGKFLTDRSMEKHRKTCGQQREFGCKLCGHRTTQRRLLRQHVKEVHKKTTVQSTAELFLQCPRCPFTCNAKYKLRGHILRRHTAEREHKCPECEYSAMYKGEIERHVSRTHRNEKRFVCDLCGGRYQTRGGLNRHVRALHEGIKAFKCEHCGNNYCDKRSLQVHVQIKHTGDVHVHVCHICGNAYNRRWNLQYHMRHVHGTSLEPLKRVYGPRKSDINLRAEATDGDGPDSGVSLVTSSPFYEKQLDGTDLCSL